MPTLSPARWRQPSRTMRSQLRWAWVGRQVQASDLYASGWNALAAWSDFERPVSPERLVYGAESGHALATGSQTPDVTAEQKTLLWADAVLLSFPLWRFGMPAILKGRIERVFALGFAYGVGEHGESAVATAMARGR